MSLAEVHHKARIFEVKVRRRNLLEYVGCAITIAGFSPTLFQHRSWLIQAAGAWTILATVFVAWQLHRRASAKTVPDGGKPLRDFYRDELVRQRDAIRSAGVWYMAPFVPGIVLLFLGRWFQAHAARRSVETDHLIIVLGVVIAALIFLVIWLLNKRGADRLQRSIDEL